MKFTVPFMPIGAGLFLSLIVAGVCPRLLAIPEVNVAGYPVIFAQEDIPGGASTHLPSLLVTEKGTVIAVCQLRKSSDLDWGHDIDLLMRRSGDGGKTWEPVRQVFTEHGVNSVNGEIVQDRATGEIFLPFRKVPSSISTEEAMISHLARLGGSWWFTTSKDDGRTWSQAREIKFQGPPGWSAWPSNSGHGIQLRSGRLVIGAFVHRPRPAGEETREMDFCSGLMLSDDHGRTWRIGATAPFDGTDEHVIAESSAGDIYDNMRLNNRGPMDLVRFFARSRDGGETYAETGTQDNMSIVNCHVGIIRWRRDGRDLLLYSGPQGPGQHMHRSSLTVRLSYDGGRTWPVARMITGPRDSSEYSDLAVTRDGTILCLYGEHTFDSHARSVLRLVRLRLDDIERSKGPRY